MRGSAGLISKQEAERVVQIAVRYAVRPGSRQAVATPTCSKQDERDERDERDIHRQRPYLANRQQHKPRANRQQRHLGGRQQRHRTIRQHRRRAGRQQRPYPACWQHWYRAGTQPGGGLPEVIVVDSETSDDKSYHCNTNDDFAGGGASAEPNIQRALLELVIVPQLEEDEVNKLGGDETLDDYDSDRDAPNNFDRELAVRDELRHPAVKIEDEEDEYDHVTEAFLAAIGDSVQVEAGTSNKQAMRDIGWAEAMSTFEDENADFPGLISTVGIPTEETRRAATSPLSIFFVPFPKAQWVVIECESNRYCQQQVEPRALEIQAKQKRQRRWTRALSWSA
ncbi:hypothetical protein PybrP1_000387 [[Pythium] brassicae (nom. inval.)]|nr:hypothetical protein PybrP1_000387 [[Pythium] brassicae (nom. inval.)]